VVYVLGTCQVSAGMLVSPAECRVSWCAALLLQSCSCYMGQQHAAVFQHGPLQQLVMAGQQQVLLGMGFCSLQALLTRAAGGL
jgi:hypothetical protein